MWDCHSMRMLFFVLLLIILFTVSSENFTFAESTFEITMPSGASDPDAAYFWSEKSTGVTAGEITVFPNDSVK